MKKITENFTLEEFACHDGTQPNAEQTANITKLCINVLQPLRDTFGAVEIMSGYRSISYNKSVGGAPNSQHTRGEAADIKCDKLDEAFGWIMRRCPYDQVILEKKGDSRWIHVSYREGQNRGNAMYATIINGKAEYKAVQK